MLKYNGEFEKLKDYGFNFIGHAFSNLYEYEDGITSMWIGPDRIIEIRISFEPGVITNSVVCKLYDLIKDGLVEKEDDK